MSVKDVIVHGKKVLEYSAEEADGHSVAEIIGLDPLSDPFYEGQLGARYSWEFARRLVGRLGAVWHVFGSFQDISLPPGTWFPRAYIWPEHALAPSVPVYVIPVQVYGSGFAPQPTAFNDARRRTFSFDFEKEDLVQALIDDGLAVYSFAKQDFEQSASRLIEAAIDWGTHADIEQLPPWEEVALQYFDLVAHSSDDGNSFKIYCRDSVVESTKRAAQETAESISKFVSGGPGDWRWDPAELRLAKDCSIQE